MVKEGLLAPVGYDCVVIKDLTDINDRLRGNMTGAHFVGARKPMKDVVNGQVKILSVKFTKVGKGTFDKFPNLRYVVCRSHGVDNVDTYEAMRRGIKVIATSPNAANCANYLKHYYDKWKEYNMPVTLFGYGAIAKAFETVALSPREQTFIIGSKTKFDDAKGILARGVQTLVVTAPLNDQTKGIINGGLLSNFEGNLISIARGGLFNHKDVLLLIKTGQILHAAMDIIKEDYQQEFMDAGVVYTEHTAWKFGGVDQSVYNANLVSLIDGLLKELNEGLQ